MLIIIPNPEGVKNTLDIMVQKLYDIICFRVHKNFTRHQQNRVNRREGGGGLFRGTFVKKNKLFVPDGMYKDIYEISGETLSAFGKKGVIFDIDNTVAPYEIIRPTAKMKDYFRSLLDAGIKIAFVSNNKNDRADVFNEELGFFCVPDAAKPSPKGIRRCVAHMGLAKDEMLLVGDQIFTDCLGAHLAGIEFFMVLPIKDKNTLFFKCKRFLEKPFIHSYSRRKAKSEK